MSWDVFLFDGPSTPDPIDGAPNDWKPEPIGSSESARAAISAEHPAVDWRDPTWGVLDGEGWSIEFNVGKDEIVDSIALHVRGGGDPLPAITSLCRANAWVAFDTSTGELLNLERPSREGWSGFTAFRDEVVGSASRRNDWRRVGAFLGLTFAVSWGGNLFFWHADAYRDIPSALVVLAWQMWIPAASAIALQLYAFEDSPLRRPTLHQAALWFYRAYLISAVIMTVIAVLTAVEMAPVPVANGVSTVLHIALLLVLLGARGRCQPQERAQAGLSFGRQRYWLWFALGYVAFMGIQLVLLVSTGWGSPQVGGLESRGAGDWTSILFFSLIVSPILAIAGTAFGEEYGWRGFLQGELLGLGARRGILLVGLIWAVWHFPIVLFGLHAYPASVIGLLSMTLVCVLLSFVLGYARIKSGSVLLAAYLHILGNALAGIVISAAPRADIVVSFGIGLPGLACLALVVAVILRDPLWRREA